MLALGIVFFHLTCIALMVFFLTFTDYYYNYHNSTLCDVYNTHKHEVLRGLQYVSFEWKMSIALRTILVLRKANTIVCVTTFKSFLYVRGNDVCKLCSLLHCHYLLQRQRWFRIGGSVSISNKLPNVKQVYAFKSQSKWYTFISFGICSN